MKKLYILRVYIITPFFLWAFSTAAFTSVDSPSSGVNLCDTFKTVFSQPAAEVSRNASGDRVICNVIRQQLSQGGYILARTFPGFQVFLNDQKVLVSPEGYWVVGFGRDAPLEQKISFLDSPSKRWDVPVFLAKRTYDIQKIEGLPSEKVLPDAVLQKRIEHENKLVAEARTSFSWDTHLLQPFMRPLDAKISGVYGSQRILNGEPKQPHYGVDFAAPKGTAVKAPAAGRVVFVYKTMVLAGNLIIIEHGLGLSSSFLHLDTVLVEQGQFVKQGEVIATVGDTGRVSAAHLDWRMSWFQERIDPMFWLAP
jgi:murein DD-endopeptidase MepM/ murein hydrolase activator NlpD